jgi:hypothetical protein
MLDLTIYGLLAYLMLFVAMTYGVVGLVIKLAKNKTKKGR